MTIDNPNLTINQRITAIAERSHDAAADGRDPGLRRQLAQLLARHPLTDEETLVVLAVAEDLIATRGVRRHDA